MVILGFIEIILIFVGTVKINQLYHKIFDITYFSLTAVITEWIICFIISGMIVSKVFGFFGISFIEI